MIGHAFLLSSACSLTEMDIMNKYPVLYTKGYPQFHPVELTLNRTSSILSLAKRETRDGHLTKEDRRLRGKPTS